MMFLLHFYVFLNLKPDSCPTCLWENIVRCLIEHILLDVNLASWDSTGGWKQNSMVYISNKACSSLKNVLGNVWYSFVKAYNVANSSCPVPVGTYITSGVDLQELKDHNFPKVYFYGKYKLSLKIKNKENKVLGCGAMELNLVRPWENQI